MPLALITRVHESKHVALKATAMQSLSVVQVWFAWIAAHTVSLAACSSSLHDAVVTTPDDDGDDDVAPLAVGVFVVDVGEGVGCAPQLPQPIDVAARSIHVVDAEKRAAVIARA